MKQELQNKLFYKFPEIFQDKNLPMSQSCMCWGIECGDGWFNLLDELCTELNKLNCKIVAEQVKEKFGTLRFYFRVENDETIDKEKANQLWDEANDLVDKADAKSAKTCEICGAEGKPNKNGWISTLCDSCYEESQD